MDYRELYSRIDGDYDELINRLGGDKMVPMLLKLFAEDKCFGQLTEAMEKEEYEAAFRAAHGFKGLCANLAMTALFTPASDLTEALRDGSDIAAAKAIYPEVERIYHHVCEELKNYL